MSKTNMVMVYSAMTEEDVTRQYRRGTAEAERSGYVPTSEVWDHNTLTVTYQLRGNVPRPDRPADSEATHGVKSLRDWLSHRLRHQ